MYQEEAMENSLSFDIQSEALEGNIQNSQNKKFFTSSYILLLIGLPLFSILFLILEHITHIVFLHHVAAIPLEILLGAVLVERFLAGRERKSRLRQLMHLKSFMFRTHIREAFIANFQALESPNIDMERLAIASLPELQEMRNSIRKLNYRSVEDLETVIKAYVDARDIFRDFMEWAISNDFESILENMVFVLHFIQDVDLYKRYHPNMLYIEHALRMPDEKLRVIRILSDGISKFLDYLIELKQERPDVFKELINEYLMTSRMMLSKNVNNNYVEA
jgi:hypothetical protein